jgi:endonuclease/exonuclease/phosphatase family metal-dependent hydrolase
MKRVAKTVSITFIVLMVAFTAFFVWASSGTRSAEELTAMTTYAAEPAAPSDTLSVMTYNIGYLSGMTNNAPVVRSESLYAANMDSVVQMLRRTDPDIIGFQEIDFGAARSFYIHQLDTLAVRLGYAASATAINWDERYVPFPYSANPAIHFGRVLSGQAVLSRYPIVRHERTELARTSRPFWSDAFYLDRLAQVVEIAVGRDTLVVINVHLEAFEEATRETQAREVRQIVERYADRPVLLIGDFNSILPTARDAHPPGEQSAFANDETLALLLDGTALRPAFPDSAYAAPMAEIGTYPTDAPSRKIDHIFYTPDRIDAVSASVPATPSAPSDHRPVVMRFVMKSAAPQMQ